MAEPLLIEIIGTHGEIWTVSGNGMGAEGVELDISPDDLHSEAPFKGIWSSSAFEEGATLTGVTWEPLDLALTFNIFASEDGANWEDVEGRFYGSFDPVDTSKIRVTSPETGTSRSLDVVKLSRTITKSKHDPRIGQYSKMQVMLRAPHPFWEGDTWASSFKASSGTGSGSVTISNPTDLPMWLQWAVTAPGTWTLPDYSFKNDSKAHRTITTPRLSSGQHLTIDTYPRTERYVADDGSNIAGLFGGVDFLHPVPPHTPETELPVSVSGGSRNAECMVRMVQYWQRPYGMGA